MDGDVNGNIKSHNIGNVHKLTVDMIKPYLSEETEVMNVLNVLAVESDALTIKSVNNCSTKANGS